MNVTATGSRLIQYVSVWGDAAMNGREGVDHRPFMIFASLSHRMHFGTEKRLSDVTITTAQ